MSCKYLIIITEDIQIWLPKYYWQMEVDDFSDSEEDDVFDDIKRSERTMPKLAAWYKSLQENAPSPKKLKKSSAGKLVVVFPDFEGFCSKVVQDVILILR